MKGNRRMKKRLTSLFLVLCMLTGMFPAYAESAHTGHDGLTFTELTSLAFSKQQLKIGKQRTKKLKDNET